jgi:hypothetical protein
MKTLFFILLLVTQNSFACDKFVIGFKGINDVFDNRAFNQYAKKQNSCAITYRWNQAHLAVKFINKNNKQYQLYGFSKGAESIRQVLPNVKRKPSLVITIGAYHTAQVNYSVYGVQTKNYFDDSGKRNVAPGVHIKNVSHQAIQAYVNKHYLGVK